MSGYEIGLSSCGFALTEENFAKLRESGIGMIEVSMRYDEYPEIDYKALRHLSERYGVRLWSYHLPFMPFDAIDPSSTSSEMRDHTVAYFRELIGRASEIGIDKFVIHPSGEPVHSAERAERLKCSMETLDRLVGIASHDGAVLAVEDLPRSCLGNTSDEMLTLLSANDRLRVCFDTNHLLKENPADFVRKLGAKIVTLHVSDCDFVNERHWLPGEGKIDWPALLAALSKIGYAGPWLYEISLTPPNTILRDRDLTFADFAENANCLFCGVTPPTLSRPKPNLGMWE